MKNQIENFRTKALLISTAWEAAAEPIFAKYLFKGEGQLSVYVYKQIVNANTTWTLKVSKFGVEGEATSNTENLIHAEMQQMAEISLRELVTSI